MSANKLRDYWNDSLQTCLNELGDDELFVVLRVAQRLRTGQSVYGELHIDTDARDWSLELAEEVLDALMYNTVLIQKLRRAK